MKKNKILYFIVSIFFFSSCIRNNDEKISTYIISPANFENTVLLNGIVEPIRFTNLTCPGNVDGIITFLIKNGTYVNEGDVVCIIEDNNRQNIYDNLLISLENAKAELSKVKADLIMQYALLEAQVKNNEADTEIAHLDSLQLKFATATQKRIKDLELEKAAIEKTKFEKKLDALKIINQSEIRKLELNIRQLTNQAESAKKILDALTIKSPKKGLAIIAESRMTDAKFKVGDNVWNNMTVVIIPEISEVKVKMMVSERDFKYINENDSVSYSFDAMPENMAYGKIIKKMPVGQPHKKDSKVKFFEVEASIDSALQLPEPGFTANSKVIVNQINDTIVIPQIAIFEVDSMKIVYVKRNKKYEMRQVSTGISSSKESIIAHGLKKGEIISLIKPPASLIKKEKALLSDSTRTNR